MIGAPSRGRVRPLPPCHEPHGAHDGQPVTCMSWHDSGCLLATGSKCRHRNNASASHESNPTVVLWSVPRAPVQWKRTAETVSSAVVTSGLNNSGTSFGETRRSGSSSAGGGAGGIGGLLRASEQAPTFAERLALAEREERVAELIRGGGARSAASARSGSVAAEADGGEGALEGSTERRARANRANEPVELAALRAPGHARAPPRTCARSCSSRRHRGRPQGGARAAGCCSRWRVPRRRGHAVGRRYA